jgi:hypothetical protein
VVGAVRGKLHRTVGAHLRVRPKNLRV